MEAKVKRIFHFATRTVPPLPMACWDFDSTLWQPCVINMGWRQNVVRPKSSNWLINNEAKGIDGIGTGTGNWGLSFKEESGRKSFNFITHSKRSFTEQIVRCSSCVFTEPLGSKKRKTISVQLCCIEIGWTPAADAVGNITMQSNFRSVDGVVLVISVMADGVRLCGGCCDVKSDGIVPAALSWWAMLCKR